MKLIQDVPTRWNSMYLMFERLEKLRSGVYYVLHDRKYTKPTECDALEIPGDVWTLIDQLLPPLQPLVEATEALSSESYPSVSCIMPMLCFLIQNDLREKPNDSQLVKKLKADIVLGLVKRFTMPGDEHFHCTVPAIASFLDPRHKTLKYIANAAVQSQLRSYVLYLMRSEFVRDTAEKQVDCPEKKRKTVFSYLEGDFNSDTANDPEDEIFRYQAEPVLIRDPLQWWNHYSSRFPTLAKLAKKFLCIMGTSVPSERVFSIAGLTVTKTRSRLDPEVVNEIIFMNKILNKRFKQEKASTAVKVKKDPDKPSTSNESNDNDTELLFPTLY